jgi:hypothetical protein
MNAPVSLSLLLPVAALPDEAAEWATPVPASATPSAVRSWLTNDLLRVTGAPVAPPPSADAVHIIVVLLRLDGDGTPPLALSADAVSVTIPKGAVADAPWEVIGGEGALVEPIDSGAVRPLDGTPARAPRTITVSSQVLTQAPPTMDVALLADLGGGTVRIVVDNGAQRAYLLVDGRVAIETPVSTARAGEVTPRGTFRITQKVERDPAEVAKRFFRHAASGTTVEVVDQWAP